MTIEGFSTTQVLSEARVLLDKNKKISSEVRLVLSLLIQLVELMSIRLATDSRTSSKPPSTDMVKKPRIKKKKKKKSKKSVGGQPGHNGSTLEQFEDPDEVIELSVDMRTLPAGEKYKPAGVETRQVVEVEMKATVCEYRAEVLEDSKGNRYVADFPAHVTKVIQYGNTVKSLAVYMSQYQLIPYARVQEIFEDQFGPPISQGTLCNFTKEAYELFEFFEQEAAETLKNTDVAHSDQAGKKECPLTVKSTTSRARGRVKQTKERNLLDRLDQCEDATLIFMKRKIVPFTNNQAEQDIRMVKVQRKISGGFRSEAGARYFCRIRGFLITQRKRGESPYTVLNELFTP